MITGSHGNDGHVGTMRLLFIIMFTQSAQNYPLCVFFFLTEAMFLDSQLGCATIEHSLRHRSRTALEVQTVEVLEYLLFIL